MTDAADAITAALAKMTPEMAQARKYADNHAPDDGDETHWACCYHGYLAGLTVAAEARSAELVAAYEREKAGRLAAERHVELLQEKQTAEGCGCVVDTPDDVCLHHSPMLVREKARADAAEAEVRQLRRKLAIADPDQPYPVDLLPDAGEQMTLIHAAVAPTRQFQGGPDAD